MLLYANIIIVLILMTTKIMYGHYIFLLFFLVFFFEMKLKYITECMQENVCKLNSIKLNSTVFVDGLYHLYNTRGLFHKTGLSNKTGSDLLSIDLVQNKSD